jgi:pullulanase/glycogen debranching enzyme
MFAFPLPGIAQITTTPELPAANKAVTITFDSSKESRLGAFTGDLYAHTGVIVEGKTEWQHVIGTWGDNNAQPQLTNKGNGIYELEITPDINSFYSVTAGEKVTKIALVLRSSDGSQQTNDLFVEVFEEGLNVSFASPTDGKMIQKNEALNVEVNATGNESIQLLLDGTEIKNISGQQLTHTVQTAVAGQHELKAIAKQGSEETSAIIKFFVRENVITEAKPMGIKNGINYIDDQTVSLVLFAPHKEFIYVIGDFNNWEANNDYQMRKDGDYFWLTISNLTPQKEYIFQYLIDGELRIADPYTDKVSDPGEYKDKAIPASVYPNLIQYPEGKTTEIASVLQTAQTPFSWSDNSFTAPAKEKLVIYELHIRDFTANGDIKTVKDTLDYLQRLGVNAIELMPFNEFEGNDSWGYNPSFYFAPDKAYGTKNDYKEFINECHKRGIAVLMDMVLNHSFGQSPLVRMYFDNGQPTINNPWYNQKSNFQHPDAQWGYDFNHESKYTQELVDSINSYWMTEYHVDGFRFDFTKGFSNTPYGPTSWGSDYDADRIRLLKRMSDEIWKRNEKAIIVFEHLADNSEETELANHGILLWGNANHTYNEATMGWHENGKSDFSWASWKGKSWDQPGLISYMESHDEERLMFKNLKYGNSNGSYNVKELSTALARMEMANAFFLTIPGPKMIWQFGELGYDVSIDENGRTGRKPIHWEYQNNPNRKRLFQITAALAKLKKEEAAFSSDNFSIIAKDALKRIEINHSDMDVRIIGNFDVKTGSIAANFNQTGTWYDFFTGKELEVNTTDALIELQPGEYHIYTSKKLTTPNILVAPEAKNVNISGTVKVDETLTASYTYFDQNDDKEGNSIYQWYRADNSSGLNEEAISGATELSYILTEDDQGKVLRFAVTPVAKTGELLNGQSISSAYTQTVPISTGINDLEDEQLQIYPNPVQDFLNLNHLGNVKQFYIANLLGKQLIVVKQTEEKMTLNLSGLSRGIYLIVFEMKDGNRISKKIIKQ